MTESHPPAGLDLHRLSPVEFEEMCYDLLACLGFQHLNWRKGTGYDASPADQGRDIECYYERSLPDGELLREEWFIDSKHHKHGVGPVALQGALAWATAKRPDHLLFIVSSFLSNPAKEYLEAYEQNNKPSFRISCWERPKLERLLMGCESLLIKYGFRDAGALDYIHPAHARFIRRPSINTLDFFLKILDQLPARERDKLLGPVSFAVLMPTFRKPETGTETLAELREGPKGYEAFKEKCRMLAGEMDEVLLVHGIVSFSLGMMRRAADPAGLERVRTLHRDFIRFLRDQIERRPDKEAGLKTMIEETEEDLRGLPDRIQRNGRDYTRYCERVVNPLLEEKIVFEEMSMDGAWP